MRLPGAQDAYRLAWRHLGRLPAPVGYALFNLGADTAWALHRLRGGQHGVGQLERNLGRVDPRLRGRALRRASRLAMRSYMRYFYEAFTLPGISPDQLRHRVRAELDPRLRADLERDSVVIAMPHMGNWDLTAAWAVQELGPVLTVAERLEPGDLFEQFVAFRESLGIKVIGQARGEKVFGQLLAAVQDSRERGERQLVALLADRDLSSAGVRAELVGHQACLAAGPAALAGRLGLALYVGSMSYERLTGARRRAAGGPWGIVLSVTKVESPQPSGSRQATIAHTRAWARALSPMLVAHAVDWHMLQAVFAADLDPKRLARRHARESGGQELGYPGATTSTPHSPQEAGL